MFLRHIHGLILFNVVLLRFSSHVSSSHFNDSTFRFLIHSLGVVSKVLLLGTDLFQGHTSWHMSHPATHPFKFFSIWFGIFLFLFSMVWYAIHRSDWITKGSTIAFVGQCSIQISHFPQSDWWGLSGTYYFVRIIKPNKSQEPFFLLIKLLFFPIQPRPDSSAHAFSRRGEVSTHIFHLQSGISRLIHLPMFFSFLEITLW